MLGMCWQPWRFWLVFLWWLGRLNTFKHVCWPFMYFFWWHACGNLLPVFLWTMFSVLICSSLYILDMSYSLCDVNISSRVTCILSRTTSEAETLFFFLFLWCWGWGSNPEPHICWGRALLLSWSPEILNFNAVEYIIILLLLLHVFTSFLRILSQKKKKRILSLLRSWIF